MRNTLTMGEFKARQKADAWTHARAQSANIAAVDVVALAYRKGLTSAQFADLVKRMKADKAKIMAVLEGLSNV